MALKQADNIQENGQVTLPAEWRTKYGLKQGDEVVFIETQQGLLILTREQIAMSALDQIADLLKEKSISREELAEVGEAIRQEIYEKKYQIPPKTDA
jgi:AbrB family looped-hinge helix DNA binding protein